MNSQLIPKIHTISCKHRQSGRKQMKQVIKINKMAKLKAESDQLIIILFIYLFLVTSMFNIKIID